MEKSDAEGGRDEGRGDGETKRKVANYDRRVLSERVRKWKVKTVVSPIVISAMLLFSLTQFGSNLAEVSSTPSLA